jgi:tricorn protease
MPCVVGRGESQTVLFVTDAEGDDAIEVVPSEGALEGLEGPDGQGALGGPRRIGAGQLGRVLEITGAPDGSLAAVATHDGRVVLIDLSDGSLRTLDRSRHGDATGLTFSPDSAWLAWSHAGPDPLRHLKLARLSDGEVAEATPLRFLDHDPVFTLDGKYLAFLSVRTFDPVYDAHVFDLSFPAGTRPYLITLQASTPSPFAAEVAGRPRGTRPAFGGAAGGGGPGASGDEPGDGGQPPAPVEVVGVEIDLDGIAERIVPFPVATGRYSHLRAAAAGVLFLAEPLLGVLGEARPRAGAEAPRARLLRYDLGKARQVELSAGLDSFEVSGDGRSVVVRDGKSLVVLPADRRAGEPRSGEEPDPDDRIEIDLGRVRIELDPPAEWRQMYDEAARLMRDHFWIPDMAGVDWNGVVARYRPWLERIATRDDLSEMIWEVQGELGSSHAYERPPERPRAAERRLGLLGADLERDPSGVWRVARVLPGETSVLAARSPLAAPGVAMKVGDAILAVDGRPVESRLGPQAMLSGAANKPVELTVLAAGATSPRRVVVEPLADERALRYQNWVAGRRAAVHQASSGRLGYVHIPDMMGNGWAELHRDLRSEVSRDALVIDVRNNGGGHVSELVLEKLARTVQAWDISPHFLPKTYPSDAPRGARVLVTDEHAGSDGDIVTAGFRNLGLGPVIGMRTWGGVIGIDGRYHLVDGSMVTQPRYCFWFYGEYGWGVENHGVDPDIEVPFPPQDWAAGRDPQLERAVEVALGLLEEHPPARPPDPATRPSRVAPPLPPRP